jgi:hypothetical protein
MLEIEDIAEVVAGAIREATAPLEARLAELEKTGTRFRGVHQRAQNYRRGDQVTSRGSLWIALRDAPEGIAPGDSPEHWQLGAKGSAQ